MTRSGFCMLLIALAAVGARARAQTCTAAGIPANCSVVRTLQFTAQRTIQVTVSPTTVNFGSPTAADYTQNFTQSSAQTITVSANNAWALTISSSQALWSNSGAGSRTDKPRADLTWALALGGSYTALTASAVSLGSSTATNATAISVFYRVAWAWTADPPGTYSLPITLVLTAP